MQGEWECSICGKINLDEDPFCIECYQDREDAEVKLPIRKVYKQEEEEEED